MSNAGGFVFDTLVILFKCIVHTLGLSKNIVTVKLGGIPEIVLCNTHTLDFIHPRYL